MSSRKTITTILDIMKHMSVRIDLMSPADWPEVCSIYKSDSQSLRFLIATRSPAAFVEVGLQWVASEKKHRWNMSAC